MQVLTEQDRLVEALRLVAELSLRLSVGQRYVRPLTPDEPLARRAVAALSYDARRGRALP